MKSLSADLTPVPFTPGAPPRRCAICDLLRERAVRRRPLRIAARAAAWALHCVTRRPATARFANPAFRLVLPPAWSGSGGTWVYLLREDYEPGFLFMRRFLGPGMVAIDGGANVGVYTFAAGALVGPRGVALGFEPGLRTFRWLERSAALNRMPQVRLRHGALSDRDGLARLYHHLNRPDTFSLGHSDRTPEGETVQVSTLRRVVADERLERLDLLKLDVEGAQELVIRGGLTVLERWKPVVMVEVDPRATGRLGLAAGGAAAALRTLGYRFYRPTPDGGMVPLPDAGARNYLAVHPDRDIDPEARS